MSNSISNTQLYQLAQAELRKTSKYKTGSIPEIEIQAKITELSKLSNWEIQAKLNDYFKAQTQEKDGWAIFGLEINQTQQTSNKKQTTQNNNQNSIILNEPDTRAFAINLLSNNANNALQAVKNYHNSIGYLSFDAVAQGITIIGDVLFDTLTGRNDYLPLIEQETNIENEIFKLDQLKNHTTSRANFNKGFKDLYGIEFNAEAFQNLQKANNELIQLNSYEALENYFDTGIKEIEKENLNNAGFKVNSILNPIFNNPIKTQEFINNLKNDCKTDEEFKTKIIETLANAKTQATKAKDEILKTTNRETLENNYKLAYKEAMGNYHSEEIVQQYLQTQQTNAMLTETALVMATSMLTMGSSAVQNLATQATTSLGTKIGGQVVKASMTAATASLPAAETVISGLTSKNGKVNLEMAGEQLKNGLIYGSFGTFVSAPLGDKLVSLLKSNPKITSTIMQKIFSGAGFGTEVSLDALFELGISSGEMGQLFKENAQGELLGRFMHMLLGGQAHHATKGLMTDVTLKQDLDANGKTVYTLSLEGKTLYQTDSPEKIIAGIASMTGEAQGLKVKDIETPKPESVNPKSTQPPTGAEKLPAIPIGEHQIRIHLPSGEKVQHELIEFSDGTIRPQTYVNGKLAKNGSTEATIPGMPKLPIGESVVTKKLPNGDEVTIIIFDKMDGSKSFTTYINNKLIKNEPEKHTSETSVTEKIHNADANKNKSEDINVEKIDDINLTSSTKDGDNAPTNNEPLNNINTYTLHNMPNANLKEYTYRNNLGTFKFMAPIGIPDKQLLVISSIDGIRKSLIKNNKNFAKLPDSTQRQTAIFIYKHPEQKINLTTLFSCTNSDEKVLKMITDNEYLNKKLEDLKDIQSCSYKLNNQLKYIEGLLNIKETSPSKYQRIKDSGIFELINSNKLDAGVLKLLNENSDLSANMYLDLIYLKENQSIVPEFAEGTNLKKVFSKTKVGDAIEVGKQMYINNGKELVEWKMTKEKYLELFPPVQRFATQQGKIADCYLIQTLNLSMANPKARAEFLQSFTQNGDDITVTIKGYEDFKGSKTFPNGEIKLPNNAQHCIGAKGMQMYEQTYATVALRENSSVDYPSTTNIDNLMDRIKLGQAAQTMAEVYGQGHIADLIRIPQQRSADSPVTYITQSFKSLSTNAVPYIQDGKGSRVNLNDQPNDKTKLYVLEKFFNDFPNKAISLRSLDLKTTKCLLQNLAKNKNYLISFGTKPKENAGAESSLLPEYNLVSTHAYSILGYDNIGNQVIIGNPHACGVETTIPLATLHQYIEHLDILKL